MKRNNVGKMGKKNQLIQKKYNYESFNLILIKLNKFVFENLKDLPK